LTKMVRPILAALCGVAVLVTGMVAGGPTASADPITDAKAKLSDLEQQTSEIEQKYNDSQARLSAAQTQQAQLTTEIADQQAKVDAMKPAIAWIVTTQRQGAGIDMTASFLLNDSPDAFLSNMATAASVNSLIDEQVARYVSEQQRLAELNDSLQTTVQTINTEVDQQKQLLDQAKTAQDAQQRLVDQLTAEQAAALAAQMNFGAAVAGAGGSEAAQAVVAWALQQVGKPYTYGGAGPGSFDCSGLTMVAYAQVGIALPHSATAQAGYGTPVDRSQLLPGDLVFFYSPISHVAIYIGNGLIVHASTPATGVKVAPIYGAYATARRLV